MKKLILTHTSNSIIGKFNSIFLGIYFLKLTNGNVSSVILFYLIKYLCTPIFSYIVCNLINKKNIVNIYRIGILLNTLIFVFLFLMESKIVNYIYLYAVASSFISMLYWQPYKNMIYNFNGDENHKKFNAYNNIVSNIIAILSTLGMGYIIINLSYMYVFAIIFIISFIAFLITFTFDKKEYRINKFENKNVKKIIKDKRAKHIFKIVFYEGIGYCGALTTAIQLVIFLNLGSEFSLGYWNAVFSILGIITALMIKKYLKKEKYVISYLISATSIIISIIPILFSKSFTYFILYNIIFNIAYQVTSILMNIVAFNIKEMELLNKCRLEYTFLQESIHAFGKIIGEIMLLFVVIFAYSIKNLQITVGVFSTTILLQALKYKKISYELKEKK